MFVKVSLITCFIRPSFIFSGMLKQKKLEIAETNVAKLPIKEKNGTMFTLFYRNFIL